MLGSIWARDRLIRTGCPVVRAAAAAIIWCGQTRPLQPSWPPVWGGAHAHLLGGDAEQRAHHDPHAVSPLRRVDHRQGVAVPLRECRRGFHRIVVARRLHVCGFEVYLRARDGRLDVAVLGVCWGGQVSALARHLGAGAIPVRVRGERRRLDVCLDQ